MDNIHIHCPHCNWEPDGQPYWQCSCGHQWDTFSTGARCPACGLVWEETQCIDDAGGCNKISPHLDWYDGLEGIVSQLKEAIKEDWLVPAHH